MDLSPEKVGGTFDVVLFLGVLYHLRDPVTALERAASVCDELLVLETETALNWLPFSAGRVYVDRDLNNDDSNWYAYNTSALVRLLRRTGFSHTSVVYRTPTVRRVGRAARAMWRQRSADGWSAFKSQRVVIHARARVRYAASSIAESLQLAFEVEGADDRLALVTPLGGRHREHHLELEAVGIDGVEALAGAVVRRSDECPGRLRVGRAPWPVLRSSPPSTPGGRGRRSCVRRATLRLRRRSRRRRCRDGCRRPGHA